MSIWALGDLHLSFGVPDKRMDVFGPRWFNHEEKTVKNWRACIKEEDLVLIPGDISWAKHLHEVMPDLKWIDSLPGTKVMIRGNHDYWWQSIKKIKEILPSSIHVIQHNTFQFGDYIVGGARLWDSTEYSFGSYVPYIENPVSRPESAEVENPLEAERIFIRELARLEMSLQEMKNSSKTRIVMTHYPPIGADLAPSRVSKLLEQYNVAVCVFGHLHNIETHIPLFGERNGVRYILTSGDYINFQPVKIF